MALSSSQPSSTVASSSEMPAVPSILRGELGGLVLAAERSAVLIRGADVVFVRGGSAQLFGDGTVLVSVRDELDGCLVVGDGHVLV